MVAVPSDLGEVSIAEIAELAGTLDAWHPRDVLAYALDLYDDSLALSFGGAEDVVLIDMAHQLGRPMRVFTLDTGRLHSATYRFLDTVSAHYHLAIDSYSPDAAAVKKLTSKKGFFSFYVDGHKECCAIRKVAPFKRALAGLAAYVTGQRRDQNPATRADLPIVQVDPVFSNLTSRIIKFNPLANWSADEVWRYIRQHDVPHNPLHDLGFRSIGCEPCTRPTHPGEHEREGRWWWEDATRRECGIHISSDSDSASEQHTSK